MSSMVSTFSSGSTLPSLHFQNGNKNEILDSSFTFIDFLPECRDPGGLFSKPEYEVFRTLIDRGNNWLQANPKWEVKTCESVEFKAKGVQVDSEKMVYLEYGETSTWYIRGLRLWLAEKQESTETAQQIGYINLVPEQEENNEFFASASYESLDDVIKKFNIRVPMHPIPGRILTIESQEMKIPRSKDLDPDQSSWVESGSRLKHFLFVIRIFFELSYDAPEEIGIIDFLPETVKSGGIFSLPQYEPFSNVVKKASEWCAEQTGIRICNMQSLEIKVKTGQEANTQKMDYTEHGGRATFYIRVLRLAYTKQRELFNELPNMDQLTCKTFVPVQLTTGVFVPEFETLHETKQRVTAWVKATGASVISAETTALRMMTGGEAKNGTETSFTFNHAERDEYWIFVIRLYMNGTYQEPPTEMLPPIPDLEEQNCCNIS